MGKCSVQNRLLAICGFLQLMQKCARASNLYRKFFTFLRIQNKSQKMISSSKTRTGNQIRLIDPHWKNPGLQRIPGITFVADR